MDAIVSMIGSCCCGAAVCAGVERTLIDPHPPVVSGTYRATQSRRLTRGLLVIVGALPPEVIQNDIDSFAAELLLEGIIEGITALTEDIEN